MLRIARVAAFLVAFAGVPRAVLGEEKAAAEGRPKNDMYFFVHREGPKKCFVVTLGRGSLFHVHYDMQVPAGEDNGEIDLHFRLLPGKGLPKDKIRHTTITAGEGSHQFQGKQAGTYSLCAVTKYKAKHRGLRLSLDFDTGKKDDLYDRDQNVFSLDDVQINMVKLKNKAIYLLKGADHLQDLESGYHKVVLRLNREVTWWPVLQVFILMATGFYQVRHLKQFFQAKRLV